MISQEELLNILGAQEPVRLDRYATIDPDYTSGLPRVIFDNETELTGKGYRYLSNYVPVGGDRVLMLKTADTYIILGKHDERPDTRLEVVSSVGSETPTKGRIVFDDESGSVKVGNGSAWV